MKHILRVAAVFSCLSFAVAGSLHAQGDALTIDPSGRVGIGTATPEYKLTLAGAGSVLGVDNNAIFYARNKANKYEPFLWPRWEDDKLYLNYGRNGFVLRNNAHKTVMVFDSIGNAGIGLKGAPTAALEVNGRIKDETGYVMPVGSIIMYAPPKGDIGKLFDASGVGLANTAVQGWAICNGVGGRPDLRGRFLVGAGPTDSKGTISGTDYRIGDVGGEEKHVMSLQEMPRHNHKLKGVVCKDVVTAFPLSEKQGDYLRSEGSSNLNKEQVEWVGDNAPAENRPPYYAVLYIIKL